MTLSPIYRLSARRRWSALALLVTAQFMVILDVAVVNVALPSIKTDLGFSSASLQWVVSAYAIFFGGTLLLGGRIGDLLGRRRVFIAGLALFSASSLRCGLAWSEASLIAFRGIQGLGGALLAPAALALLMTTFAEGHERNRALGIYGAASGSGAAAGVLLGGVLTSYLHWSWIFFVNVPVGLAAIALAPVLLRESRANLAHRHFDIAGAATITGGLMLFVYAPHPGGDHGWGSPGTLGLIGALGRARRAVRLDRAPGGLAAPAAPHLPRCRRLPAANITMAIVGAVDVLGVLRPHALPAGRPALHGDPVRRRVHRLRRDGGRRLQPGPACGRAVRRPADADCRARARGGVPGLARPPARRRPLLLGSFPGVRDRRSGPRAVLRVDLDREPGRRRAPGRGHRCGLFNTSRQIGGAIGIAAVSAIAATASSSYASAHDVAAASAPALDHGFQTALIVSPALLAGAAVLAWAFVRPRPVAEVETVLFPRHRKGGCMTVMAPDTKALLDREVDDLLLDVRGLALVRDLLRERGATSEEIDSHERALTARGRGWRTS